MLEKNHIIDLAHTSPYYAQNKNGTTISDVSIEEIMEYAATPSAYIYDANTINHNYCKLREALPKRVELFYAVKANPNLAIVQLLASYGAGIDIASRGELLICQKLKLASDNITYTAPVKNEQDLRSAIKADVYINVESLHEAKLLSSIASNLGRQIVIGLRINPDFHITSAHLTLSGDASSKFGIDIENVVSVYQIIKKLSNVRVTGIHISVASGVLSAEAMLEYYEYCFSTAKTLAKHFTIDRIDMGGGLGIPYFPEDCAIDIHKLGTGLQKIIDNYPTLSSARLIIEPGRYLVGTGGIYVCTIDHIKTSRGRELLMVDGGIHHYSRPALVGRANPTVNLSKRGLLKLYDVADKTATSAGYFGKKIVIAKASPGDFLGILNTGSYGLTQSTALFLSHDMPPEILIMNGTSHMLRNPVTAERFIEDQHIVKL